jgi:hypothetical protein
MRTGGYEYRLQKPWSELVSWAREELSLRPPSVSDPTSHYRPVRRRVRARTIIRKPLVSIAWSSFALTMRVDLSVDLAVTASDEIVGREGQRAVEEIDQDGCGA